MSRSGRWHTASRNGSTATGHAPMTIACPRRSRALAYAEQVGADGLSQLTLIWKEQEMDWLWWLPAVQILWRVWLENYTWADNERLRWRETEELPPAGTTIRSPYDEEVRYAQKRSMAWVGYKVHLTETCDKDAPAADYPCRNHGCLRS